MVFRVCRLSEWCTPRPPRPRPRCPQDLETKINDYASTMETLAGEIETVKAELVDLTMGLQQVRPAESRTPPTWSLLREAVSSRNEASHIE